jgi:CHAD domain-containing protein
MAESKWIGDLSGDAPMEAAARRVLELRLGLVAERLPAAVYHSNEDIEHVHQLRVSTRRAGAAVRIFEECLPSKAYDAIRKTLRKIRRAAGEARDWDVFLEALSERAAAATDAQKAGLDFLLGFAQGQRTVAQRHLDDLTPIQLEFEQAVKDTLDAVDGGRKGDTPLRRQAVPLLMQLIHDLEEAASQDLQPYEHLHQVRILGKQLRYAMEVFAICFAPAFRDEIYPEIVAMQEILGLANDSYVAHGRLSDLKLRLQKSQPALWKRYRSGIDATLRFHQRRLPEQRRQFARWWAKWKKSGAEALLESLLH